MTNQKFFYFSFIYEYTIRIQIMNIWICFTFMNNLFEFGYRNPLFTYLNKNKILNKFKYLGNYK